MSGVKVETREFLGWQNCISISNDTVELIVTTDVGPRIIYYGFNCGPNHMKVFDYDAGVTGGNEWRSFGGHRLWHSPEVAPRTYEVENTPCQCVKKADGVILKRDADEFSRMEKEIEITLSPKGTTVDIEHRIRNLNAWDIRFAAWALTVVAPGGRLVIPQSVTGPVFLPNRSISLWTYTRLNDPRVKWLDRYIFLDQDEGIKYTNEKENRRFDLIPFKIGMHVPDGWVGYTNHGQMFVKYFSCDEKAEYPDYGHSSFETYTNYEMLEIETLSPLKTVEPGDHIEHSERWALFDNVRKPESEDEADKSVAAIAFSLL